MKHVITRNKVSYMTEQQIIEAIISRQWENTTYVNPSDEGGSPYDRAISLRYNAALVATRIEMIIERSGRAFAIKKTPLAKGCESYCLMLKFGASTVEELPEKLRADNGFAQIVQVNLVDDNSIVLRWNGFIVPSLLADPLWPTEGSMNLENYLGREAPAISSVAQQLRDFADAITDMINYALGGRREPQSDDSPITAYAWLQELSPHVQSSDNSPTVAYTRAVESARSEMQMPDDEFRAWIAARQPTVKHLAELYGKLRHATEDVDPWFLDTVRDAIVAWHLSGPRDPSAHFVKLQRLYDRKPAALLNDEQRALIQMTCQHELAAIVGTN